MEIYIFSGITVLYLILFIILFQKTKKLKRDLDALAEYKNKLLTQLATNTAQLNRVTRFVKSLSASLKKLKMSL